MQPPIDKNAIEQRVRDEFAIALDELENASPEEKPRAATRLNRAVRMLIDLVAHGKLPTWRAVGRDKPR